MKQYPILPPCSRPTLYHKKDDTLLGVCDEVGDFLYGLVRMVKPARIIETGAHVGDSAVRMAEALRDNKFGHLHTCDVDHAMVERATRRLAGLPATVHHVHGSDLIASYPDAEFYFIDSGDANVRWAELAMLRNVPPGGVVAWHDACVGYDDLYERFANTHDWPHLILPSIVGIAIFQRPFNDIVVADASNIPEAAA